MKTLQSMLRLFISIVKVFLLLPVYWVSGFLTRRTRRIAFGCHLSKPAGNVLHFFRHCLESGEGGYEFVWVAKNKESYDFISELGLPVVKKYSMLGFWWCLTSEYYCYSSYVSDVSYFLSRKVKGVNVWHGTPLKKIEADIDTGIYKVRYIYESLFKLLQPWVFFKAQKVFVSSEYETQCFSSAFRIGDDVMYKTYPPRLVGLNKSVNKDSVKNILIAPTFRDGTELQYDNLVDFYKLDEFGAKNNIIFHLKAHPSDTSLINLDIQNFSNVKKIDRLIDIYSVLSKVDAVITDYSSIFFDCSYIGVSFFLHWPDADFYEAHCRGFYFDARKEFSAVFSDDMNGLLDNLRTWVTSPPRDDIVILNKFSCYVQHPGYPISVFGDGSR